MVGTRGVKDGLYFVIISLGIGYKYNQKLNLGASASFVTWSDTDDIKLSPNAGPENSKTFYKNSFVFGTGAEYELDERFSLMGGLKYSQAATPQNTSIHIVADDLTDLLIGSFGVEYRGHETRKLYFIASYIYAEREKRDYYIVSDRNIAVFSLGLEF
jgi:long-chain fatty acid transport protein